MLHCTTSLTLFYPMFNESESVEPMTRKALAVLQDITEDYEILIIDDGSTDGSGHIADWLAESEPRVRVLRHSENRGYGQALRTGLASATKDVIAYTDCDEPADLWLLREALPLISTHDLVIGYRINRWDGFRRAIYSAGYNWLIRALFDVRVRDVNFSFKLIRREALGRIHLTAESVFIDGELLAEATRNGMTIYEIPVPYQSRRHGASHFDSLRAASHALREIKAYWELHHSEDPRVADGSHVRTSGD